MYPSSPSSKGRKGVSRRGSSTPLRQFRSEVSRLFDDLFRGAWNTLSPGELEDWEPQIEILEDETSFTVRAELPGVDPKDLDVSINEDALTISGEKKEESAETSGQKSRSERWYGSFLRMIPLPEGVDSEKVATDFAKGVLTVRFERREGKSPRRIPVSSPGEPEGDGTEGRKVKDVMTRDVECVGPETPVRDVAQKMKDLNLGSFPVCYGDRVVGMITDRDLTLRILGESKDASTTPVSEVMTREVVVCAPDSTIEEAESKMKEHQVRRLPVVDEGRLVGFFSIGKVARAGESREAKEVLKSVTESPKKARDAGQAA